MPIDLRALIDPAHTAVILQELQEGVVGEGSSLPALAKAVADLGVIDRAVELTSAARNAGVPVVHCKPRTFPGGSG